MKKIVHVISHTHWDREWYMPYEKHHLKLIKLMDSLIDVLERDEAFKSFHLDGQTIILDDYLQVRPDMRGKIENYIKQGRLIIGPWYILQDEFLTSGEANVRNLLIGHRDAAQFGSIAKIGYFPDSFGNMGQAPQLLRQAGIDNAVFGRGVKPTGQNNTVADAAYESPYSEMLWESPDGSQVLGILFANWYHNGMEIPVDAELAERYWKERISNVEQYASTPHLLFMNGCDHQPVQRNLSAALATARTLFPDIEFVHSNFPDYIRQTGDSLPEDLTIVRGELRSQRTDGWGTLVNTASARVYIKQANQHCQMLLERTAEPLAALAHSLGSSYPHPLFVYNWKLLMQNHPHDSICGCSVDEVHSEMMTRFAKSRELSEGLVEESLAAIKQGVDTSFLDGREGAVPFLVINTAGFERSGLVTVELNIAREPLYEPSPAIIADRLRNLPVHGMIVDRNGTEVPAEIEDLGIHFGYDLPEDRFRQPFMARRIRVQLHAEAIPAVGYAAYGWVSLPEPRTDTLPISVLPAVGNVLENEHLTVTVASNGTFSLLDRNTGRLYENLGLFEDVGDIGNEYMFKQSDDGQVLTTADRKARVEYLENTSLRQIIRIVHEWEIPESADDTLIRERENMVFYADRKAQRSDKSIPLQLCTELKLDKGERTLKIKVSYNNQAKDHRLRMLFPTGLRADTHHAESIFEVAERANVPASEWTNPSNCQHQQGFVAIDEAEAGLAVANLGLNEYEVLNDGHNTIAVTLLRCVGELGDWGVFPTEEAQCIGEQHAELAIIPYNGSADRHRASVETASFQTPWRFVQSEICQGRIPSRFGMLEWSGGNLLLSAVKVAEETGDTIYRWYNTSLEPTVLTIHSKDDSSIWYRSNVLEERIVDLYTDRGTMTIEVKPAEILTIGHRSINE